MRTAAFLVIAGMAVPGFAQSTDGAALQYTVASWTDEDGLPSNQIRAMAQDRDGYLWLGTDAGLVRFDGVTFISWGDRGSRLVPDGEVNALCATLDGSLWVAHDGHLSRLRHDEVVHFGAESGVPQGRLTLLEDHTGVVWVGGIGGVARFLHNHWERVRIAGVSAESVRALYEDRGYNLWVGTTAAIYRRAAGADAFARVEVSRPVYGFSEDGAGSIWVTDPGRGLRRVAWPGGAGRSRGALEGEHGSAVIHDHQGATWLGTRGSGLLRAVGAQPESPHVRVTRFRMDHGLANDVVASLLEDRDGNIWVGTQGGLNRLAPRLITLLTGTGVAGGTVRSLLATRDGGVWAATAGGLSRFSGGQRRVYTERNGLPSADVTALHEDARGVLWVGTDRGLARFVNGRFLSVPLPQHLRRGPIVTVTSDSAGVLWFFHLNEGLYRWRDGTLAESDRTVAGRPIRSSATDRQGRVWLGFLDGGVAVFEDNRVRLYSERDGLAGGRVEAIFEDSTGMTWIGTAGGLSRFSGDRFETLSSSRLPGKPVSAIVGDESGRLWLRVGSGLVGLEPREFDKAVADPSHGVQWQFYDASDGLPGLPVLLVPQSAVRAADGTIWIVTANGISIVDPRHLPEHHRLPAVQIEEVSVDQHSFTPQPGFRVPARASRLEIRYAAATLSPPRVRFRYMLEGFDSDWVAAGRSRRAVYTNLSPGRYRFRVASGNMDGIWAESAATWEFTLVPAFYQTLWFDGLCVLVVAVIVLGAWQWRAARDRAKLAEMRSDFVASVTHELKTPIAAIRAAGETLTSGRAHGVVQRDYAQLIIKEAKRLTRSVDNLLAFSRITDVGTGHCREPLALDALIRESLEEFRPQLVVGGFHVNVDVSPALPAIVVDRQAVSLVLTNLFDNAIRYSGPARQVDIRVRSNGNHVRLEVCDRGSGIPPDELPHVTRKFYRGRNARAGGSGLGLAIVNRVVTEHGGTLSVASDVGIGTTVCVTFPANGTLHEQPDPLG